MLNERYFYYYYYYYRKKVNKKKEKLNYFQVFGVDVGQS